MIKITVNPEQDAKTFSFDQELIIIGEGSPDRVDICFPLEGLHQNHLRIIRKGSEYWVINQANDPFVSHNGHPFGKKRIDVGDIIQIRDHTLKIESLQEFEALSFAPSEPKERELPAEPEVDSYNPFPDVENLANDENPEAWYPLDLSPQPLNEEKDSNHSIEEAYSRKETKRKASPQPAPPPPSDHGWHKRILKIIAASIISSVVILTLIMVELYFRASGESEREEMLAAESIADYAMALTYATVYHISPQKQNWIDPLFIKNNLTDLLSTTSIACGNIDAEGIFCNCPYILRFYTNRDFSRFLLLAQPAPTVSQWLIPKDTLLIDSHLMDIRKIEDLKTLNRLLSNQNPLDESNGREVLATIQQSKVIPLHTLAKTTGKREFAPPKALRYLKSGAENRIYNAPRYHQFTSILFEKVLSMINGPLNPYEILMLQNELETLSKFQDLIFYSPGGIHQALNGYKALKKLSLPYSFFTAYLLVSEKGDILSSHLILDKEIDELIKTEEKNIAQEDASPSPLIKTLEKEELLSSLLREKANHIHKELQPILVNLYTWLGESLEKESIHLNLSFFELVHLYQSKERQFQLEIEELLKKFRLANPMISELLVERILREYGILDLYQNSLYLPDEAKLTTAAEEPPAPNWEAYRNLIKIAERYRKKL